MIDYIENKEEWDAFWDWFIKHLPNSVVVHSDVERTSFEDSCKIALYDWWHYKRINMGKYISERY